MMIQVLISIIIWMLFAFFEGIREANYKHHRDHSKSQMGVKIQTINIIQRILFLIIINLHLLSHIGWISIISTLSMLSLFPFIHNGTYFIFRNKLNPGIFPHLSYQDCNKIDERPSMYLKNKVRTNISLVGIFILLIICFIK